MPDTIFKGHLEISDSEEATLYRTQIETGGADEFRAVTRLTLTLDSTSWTDWEDDVWCFFLRAFAPLSSNLQSLTVHVRGDRLFTADNHVKPAVSYSCVVPATDPDPCSEDEDDGEGDGDGDGDKEASPTTPKRARGRPRKTTPGPGSATPPAPAPATPARLRTVAVPADEVGPHVSEKAIVGELLRLHAPLAKVTITGPVQISLRRRLVQGLNPGWRDSPHCLAQCGFALAPDDAAALAVVEHREAHLGDDARAALGREHGMQDAEDWGLWKRCGVEDVAEKVRLPKDWVVPTGKAGRNVASWRAAGAWRGPSGAVKGVEVKEEEEEDE